MAGPFWRIKPELIELQGEIGCAAGNHSHIREVLRPFAVSICIVPA
jgi:hypothetical protein